MNSRVCLTLLTSACLTGSVYAQDATEPEAPSASLMEDAQAAAESTWQSLFFDSSLYEASFDESLVPDPWLTPRYGSVAASNRSMTMMRDPFDFIPVALSYPYFPSNLFELPKQGLKVPPDNHWTMTIPDALLPSSRWTPDWRDAVGGGTDTTDAGGRPVTHEPEPEPVTEPEPEPQPEPVVIPKPEPPTDPIHVIASEPLPIASLPGYVMYELTVTSGIHVMNALEIDIQAPELHQVSVDEFSPVFSDASLLTYLGANPDEDTHFLFDRGSVMAVSFEESGTHLSTAFASPETFSSMTFAQLVMPEGTAAHYTLTGVIPGIEVMYRVEGTVGGAAFAGQALPEPASVSVMSLLGLSMLRRQR